MKWFYALIGSTRQLIKPCCLCFLLLLNACGGGSDGATGSAGPAGPAGPAGETPTPPTTPTPDLPVPTALAVSFSGVTIDNGTVTAQFKVVDQNGVPYPALSGYRFTIVQLVPGQNGNSHHWQSYINRVEQAGAAGPGVDSKIQATTENNGELVYQQDGLYSYTFATNIAAVTDPITVNYDPNYSHRIGLQISGNDIPTNNTVYTWQPATGATDGILSRQIVNNDSCNSCHGELALHGGGRKDVDYCVTCHNPGSSDANSGESVDFSQLIHKIHRGASLPSVVAGGEYAIWGFRNSKHDYSDVHFPQDIRNCTKCHNDTDATTPDAQQWHLAPSIQACGSCHDDVNFALGKEGGHEGGVMLDNSECTVCHKAGGLVGSVKESHQNLSAQAALSYVLSIVSVNNTDRGQFPQITYKVTDPLNQQSAYDVVNHPAFTAPGGASRLAFDLAWGAGRDYTNQGSGSGAASTVSINALQNPQDNGDGSFTVQSAMAIPAVAQGTLAIGFEGHPAADLDGDGVYSDRIAVPSVVEYASINGDTITPRREVVAIEKCQNCHQQLSLHGNNRTDNIQLCATCHNPNNTDINRRPADTTTTADGKKEATIDFKQMIHGIHGAHMRTEPLIVYGFGGSVNDFSHVKFPGQLNNCLTCHNPGTYELPLSSSVLATTADTGALLNDPSDDLNITATAAVCSSCHDTPLAKAHMRQNGGASFAASQKDIDDFVVTETCQFCHGVGQQNDIKTAHGIK